MMALRPLRLVKGWVLKARGVVIGSLCVIERGLSCVPREEEMVSHTLGLTKEGDRGQEVWGCWREKQTTNGG